MCLPRAEFPMGATESSITPPLTDDETARLAMLVEIAGGDGHGIYQEVISRGDILNPFYIDRAKAVRIYVETGILT